MRAYHCLALSALALAGLAAGACSHAPEPTTTGNKNITLVRNAKGVIQVPNQIGPYHIAKPYAQTQPQTDLGPLPKGSVPREFNGLKYYVVPLNEQAAR